MLRDLLLAREAGVSPGERPHLHSCVAGSHDRDLRCVELVNGSDRFAIPSICSR